ncbi:T9SS type A sorting domain-containing protein [Pontibacter ruber]|uniref:T9SS type A sorting domain-containing protein n=1 Tax=Pontibacter ruber TaxID=1343895 RepID=A0ABW5D2X2_9BACT|nr:T9SS type A sorting domain-containing protein [Pontibacter ruber]
MKLKLLLLVLQLLLYFMVTTAAAQQLTRQWVQRLNGVAGKNEAPVDVAVDAEGNSYVTGSSFGAIDPIITNTVKYSPTGEQLWVAQNKTLRSVSAIEVDNAGGVYITGYLLDSVQADFVTIRYDAATGEQVWLSSYGTAGNNDLAVDLAVDSAGGIYVTGSSSDAAIIGNATVVVSTVRYEATTGKETWSSTYDRPGSSDRAAAIAVDNQGRVYVTGTSSIRDTVAALTVLQYNATTGDEIWASRYEGPSGSNNIAVDMAIDDEGVYVTGFSFILGSASDFITIRFDAADGTQRWAKYFVSSGNSNEIPYAIEVDNQGGVYVTGSSGIIGSSDTEYVTVKYEAATGEEIWNSRYNGSSELTDQAFDIAVDNQGGVFVTGYSFLTDFDTDYATVRYDAASGQQVWVMRYSGPEGVNNRFNIATAIAFDNQGGIIVTGESFGDYGTVRYNATTGEQLWVQRFNVEENVNDFAISVAVDAEGNSYVTGTSEELFPRLTTVKYSPTGELLWVVKFEGLSWAQDIAVDNQGGVYVTGQHFGEEFSPDIATIRYDAATGAQVWARSYNGPAAFWPDSAAAITVDNQGGVFVTGVSYNEEGGSEFATVRYNATSGEQTWVSRYSGENSQFNHATAITVDNQGGVYVTGYSFIDSTNTAYITVRYAAANGQQTWATRYNESGGTEIATDIAADNTGGIYVTGYSRSYNTGYDYATIQYEAATGAENWVSRYNGQSNRDDLARAIAADTSGGVYVTGTSFVSDSLSDFATVRYDAATGAQAWASRYDELSDRQEARDIAIDRQGGIFVTGVNYSDQNADFATVRYDPVSGEQTWVDRYNSANNNEDIAVTLAVDARNNVIVTGYSFDPATRYDFLTIKYGQCPTLAAVSIAGDPTVAVNTDNSPYSFSVAGASTFIWNITDIDGNAYTDFSGQGTDSISVDWPAQPNVYKLTAFYTAGEGCEAGSAVSYVYVSDAEAGFVTGAGWSDSPPNPDYELMQRRGNLFWGLLAGYEEQDDVQGMALVVLESGPDIFRSTSLEDGSLVISGNKAFFKGRGSLTHLDGFISRTDDRRFGFLVAATDGHFGPGSASDQLRLKIWVLNADGSEGEVVYDNQVGCSTNLDENAIACAGIKEGDVVINNNNDLNLFAQQLTTLGAAPETQEFQAFPTVFSDRTTLAFTTDRRSDYTLELYDLKGALVRKVSAGTADAGKRYEQEIQAEGLERGLYLVRLTTDSKVQTVKLIVQK